MKKITIAIDGYSSTGKSTVAKQLADHLGYVYVDTGAMYRAVTLYAMQHGFIDEGHFDVEKLIQSLSKISLDFKQNKKGFAEIHLNGKNVENEIRSLHVSEFVSTVSALHKVRVKLVQQQQKMGHGKGVVMDGRDIGTVVFPAAELKIFMNATADERAQRRYKELLARKENVTFDEVLENIRERDHIDSTRQDSPLKKAVDAVEINNSEMDQKDQFEIILQLAEDRIFERI